MNITLLSNLTFYCVLEASDRIVDLLPAVECVPADLAAAGILAGMQAMAEHIGGWRAVNTDRRDTSTLGFRLVLRHDQVNPIRLPQPHTEVEGSRQITAVTGGESVETTLERHARAIWDSEFAVRFEELDVRLYPDLATSCGSRSCDSLLGITDRERAVWPDRSGGSALRTDLVAISLAPLQLSPTRHRPAVGRRHCTSGAHSPSRRVCKHL